MPAVSLEPHNPMDPDMQSAPGRSHPASHSSPKAGSGTQNFRLSVGTFRAWVAQSSWTRITDKQAETTDTADASDAPGKAGLGPTICWGPLAPGQPSYF